MAAKNVKKSGVIAYALMAVLALISLIVYLNNNGYISTAPTAKDEFFQSYNVHASLITWLTIGGIACCPGVPASNPVTRMTPMLSSTA